MVRQNCQNWHLSVVLLCFFVVSSHVDDGLLQSNVSSQFSVGNGAHVREKAAPAHGASFGRCRSHTQQRVSVSNCKSLISCLWDSLCLAQIYQCLFSVDTSKLNHQPPPETYKPWIVISEWKTMTCDKTRHYPQSGSKMKTILVLWCLGLWSPSMSDANPQFGMTFPDGKPIWIYINEKVRLFKLGSLRLLKA